MAIENLTDEYGNLLPAELGDPGDVLTVNPAGDASAWAAPSGGGGGFETQTEPSFTIGSNRYFTPEDLNNSLFIFFSRFTSGGNPHYINFTLYIGDGYFGLAEPDRIINKSVGVTVGGTNTNVFNWEQTDQGLAWRFLRSEAFILIKF